MPAYVVLNVRVREREWHPSRFVILEFPTAELGRAWWSSQECGPAKGLLQSCADTEMVLVEGVSG